MAEFAHIALNCQDPLAVERWYTNHFGFKRIRLIDLGGGNQIVFSQGSGLCLEFFKAEQEAPSPPQPGDGPKWPGIRHLAFRVDDVDAKLKEMGDDAVISLGPLDFDDFIPHWRTVWLKDPEGNIVEISQGFVPQDAVQQLT
jgi:glyoxylase I family protein